MSRRENRYINDNVYKRTTIMRSTHLFIINKIIKNGDISRDNNVKCLETLGITIDGYKKYIENKFTDTMNWQNHGNMNNPTKWQIDHIIPISSFDFNIEENFMKAFHYSNTQPLMSNDHKEKTSIEAGFSISKKFLHTDYPISYDNDIGTGAFYMPNFSKQTNRLITECSAWTAWVMIHQALHAQEQFGDRAAAMRGVLKCGIHQLALNGGCDIKTIRQQLRRLQEIRLIQLLIEKPKFRLDPVTQKLCKIGRPSKVQIKINKR